MQRRTTDFWLQSLSSLLPYKQHSVHLKDTLQGSLVLTQTTAYNTDPTTHTLHPKYSLSLQYASKSIAQTPQILIIPRHQPFISIASKTCTTAQQSHWRSGEFQQLAKQLPKTKQKKILTTSNHPPIRFFLPPQCSHHSPQNPLAVFF